MLMSMITLWSEVAWYPIFCPSKLTCDGIGGTAGCVLASRLSEDPNVSVLVLERGIANDTYMSRVPLVSSNIISPDMGATSFYSEPMKNCEDRRSLVFRGEVLGGGSRINGMVYTRGSVADYDAWSAMGHPEWSYEKVLPYFVRGETAIDWPQSKHRGQSGAYVVIEEPSKSLVVMLRRPMDCSSV